MVHLTGDPRSDIAFSKGFIFASIKARCLFDESQPHRIFVQQIDKKFTIVDTKITAVVNREQDAKD